MIMGVFGDPQSFATITRSLPFFTGPARAYSLFENRAIRIGEILGEIKASGAWKEA
jgi:hypothetical protein